MKYGANSGQEVIRCSHS